MTNSYERDREVRHALLKKIHWGRKVFRIDEDDYRALLKRITGKDSAGKCSADELDAVVAEYRRMGLRFSGRPEGKTRRAGHPVAKKARAMWISLYELGAIEDASEPALEAFGKRQLGVDRLQWADQSQGARLIEALKAIAARNGWDASMPGRMDAPTAARMFRIRVLELQVAKLRQEGEAADLPEDMDALPVRRLDASIRFLGARLRAVRARKAGA
jgi:phage gp16-like protein